MKVIAKTESFSEFVARGGTVTKCPTRDATKKYSKRVYKEKPSIEDVDMSAIPMALKISLGIRK